MENSQNYNSELEGKIALITWGTKGIGRAIAESLSKAGAKVIITARNSSEESKNREILTTYINPN